MDRLSPASAGFLHALLLATDEERVTALSAVDVNEDDSFALTALLERLRRLDELEHEFESTLRREKLGSLRELAYGASHEINNPLANISTRAQTLLRDETDPERRRKLATINSQAFRAHEMISDMMLFAKPPDLICEPTDLSALTRDVVAEVMKQADEQGTLILTNGLDHSCVVPADANHLAVALKALVRNSLEAVEAGGRITISLEDCADGNSDTVTLSVRDTGPGIPAEVERHIFDPFYSGREAGRGLGFGLSKCWRIVTLHGGSIEAESGDDFGTVFTIRLPIAATATPALTHG